MKKSIPEYITALSDNNFNLLEEIFMNKYFKFKKLYRLISEYSDFITSLTYKESRKDILKVEMTLANVKANDVVQKILNCESDNDKFKINASSEKKVVYIEIKKNETIKK